MKNRFEPLFQAHLQRIIPSAIWELALCSDPTPIVFRDGAWNFYILHKYSPPPSLARSYLITGLLYLSIMLNIHSLPPGPLSHPSPLHQTLRGISKDCASQAPSWPQHNPQPPAEPNITPGPGRGGGVDGLGRVRRALFIAISPPTIPTSSLPCAYRFRKALSSPNCVHI